MTGKRHAGRIRLLAITLVVGAACVAVGPRGAVGAAPVGDCPSHGRVVCVDRGDGGRSVHVQIGRTLMVVLNGSTLRWSGLREVGPVLLRPKGAVSHRGGGLTASYVAAKAGRTTLRAGGAPQCAPGKACPQFLLLWQVRVVVG